MLYPACRASLRPLVELIADWGWCVSRHDDFNHDDVIKWKHFPRYWPFVRRIHRSPVNSPHKGQWRGALMFSLTSARINGWENNREAGNVRRIHPHCDVTVMVHLLACRIGRTHVIRIMMHTYSNWSIHGCLLSNISATFFTIYVCFSSAVGQQCMHICGGI